MKIVFRLCLIFLLYSCSMTTFKTPKINGVSFVASRIPVDSTHVKPVVNINANYAAIMPLGFIRDLQHPEILYNTDRQWFGESFKGVKQYIRELNKKHIQVMMKPQIWIWRGEYTGHLKMTNEQDWKTLERSYSNFILDYAKLAQEANAEILCIGTELEKFIENRPKYWENLIKKIKTVYKGKLTYAANWDEFKRTPFWNKLDYIGVDAYFPVSDMQTPTVEDSKKGWVAHKKTIKDVSNEHNKPVLFTEYGYRSVDYSGREPWRSERSMGELNLQAQVNTTQALFETFWEEEWFAGGFIWKWFVEDDKVGGLKNHMFTPQNKPVEAIIKETYSSN